MRRSAVAVLLFLFVISAVAPSLAVPSWPTEPTALYEHTGIDDGSSLFDEFAQTLIIPGEPRDSVLADLNNDTREDLAVIYKGSTSLDVFFFDPAIGFSNSNRTRIALPYEITDLAIGDMDGDTKLDIVLVLNVTALTNLVVLYQSSNFQMGSSFTKPIDYRPLTVNVGNFTGSSLPEIALTVMAAGGPRFLIYEWSIGTYQYWVEPLPLNPAPLSMVRPSMTEIGDLNQDGLNDLVIGDRTSGKVAGFLNPGHGAWGANYSTSRNLPTTLMLGDLDGDGSLELTVAEEGLEDPLVTVWDCTPTGFSAITNIDTISTMNSLAALKLNTDLRMEIAAASADNNDISIFKAAASGSLSYPESINFPVPRMPVSIFAADMNGDGEDDILLTSCPSNGYGAISVYLQSGDTLSNANDNQPLPVTQVNSATVGDMDGDGGNEIITYDGSGPIIWFSREGFPELRWVPAPLNVSVMECVDLNGDGREDLVMVQSAPAQVTVWYGDPDVLKTDHAITSVSLAYSMSQGLSMTAGDLDGDGDLDLAIGGDGAVDIFWNSGTAAAYSQGQRFTLTLAGASVTSLTTIRIQGSAHNDALRDLALVNGTTSRTEIYFQQTTGARFVTSDRLLLTPAAGLFGLTAKDLSGDGREDLLAGISQALRLLVQNPGYTKGFLDGQTPEDLPVPERPRSFTIGDLDDDGAPEIGLMTANSTIEAYERTGMGFVLLTRQTAGSSPAFLSLADMDDDGKQDIVVVSSLSRTTSIYYQNNFAPTAKGSVDGSGHLEGDYLTFNATLSTDGRSDRDRLTYIWDFGDGGTNTTTEKLTTHRYLRNDTFQVVLTARDPAGLTNHTSFQVSVGDKGPSASLTYDGTTLFEGTPVQFRDNSTSFPDTIDKWRWAFGDGGTSELRNPSHTYAHNGNYTVTLTVWDKDGTNDTASIAVIILDTAPTAQFSFSPSSPLEGQNVTFTDASSPGVDSIESWYWDFGDGRTLTAYGGSVQHIYTDNGTYLVSLTITDADGSNDTITRTVVVLDTSPVISSLYVVGGSTSFKEGDDVEFKVNASPLFGTIVRYQWDFQTETFQADETTNVYTAIHSYNFSGTYRVTVRVWDIDSYTDTSIQITITDPAPVPDFTASTNAANRTVSFSAALTLDTENDMPLLEYRWFFGDGEQSEWSNSSKAKHTYDLDGIYSVRLEVRDDHNPAVMRTKNVTIDLLPPIISMDDPVLKAIVGEPTLVRVNVTDLVGIGSVKLEYTIGNVTRTVVMTHEGGGIYFAQIPAQNRTMELQYRIIAEDMAGHSATTEQFTLALEYEDPSLFIYTSLILLTAFLVIIIYLFLSRPIVDEVFVMYHDGTLLAHQTRRLKPGMDDEILGGMLIALQNFVRDSFKDENSTVLRRMDFGERKLLVERKDDFFMAVVLSGKRAGNAAQRMLRVLDNIEEGYAPVLREWDGDLEKVRGIRDETKPMFSRANPLDLLKRKEGEDDSI